MNHVTELDVSIYADPGSCYSSRTIPPCLADYGASPPQSALSQQATLYRALFTAFNRPSVTSVTTLGHRRQSHLAQFLAGHAHESPAAVRYRPQSQVGVLGGGRSDDLRALILLP